MSSFRDEVYALLFGYIRVWEGENGRWAVGLEPLTLGDAINPMPPGQLLYVGDEVEVRSELDYLEEPGSAAARLIAYDDGVYSALWAGRPHFKTRESALKMIYGWVRRERPELLAWCTREAMDGRAWRAAQERKRTQ